MAFEELRVLEHRTGLRYLLNESSELTLVYACISAISVIEITGFLEVSLFFLTVANVLCIFFKFFVGCASCVIFTFL